MYIARDAKKLRSINFHGETLDAVIFDIADFGDPSNSHTMAKNMKKWSITVHLRVSQQETK